MARFWPSGKNLTRRNLLTAAGGGFSLGFLTKCLSDWYYSRQDLSNTVFPWVEVGGRDQAGEGANLRRYPTAENGVGAAPARPPKFIDVNDFKKTMTVEKLCATAEGYYAVLNHHWDYLLAKPLSDVEDAPQLLHNFARVLSGLDLRREMSVLDFGAGSCWASRWLSQLGMEVIALDVSKTALKIGEELYAPARHREGPATPLPGVRWTSNRSGRRQRGPNCVPGHIPPFAQPGRGPA